MGVYSVRGRSAETAVTADHCVVQLWNPSAVRKIRLLEFGAHLNTALGTVSSAILRRTSARGTPGSTVTPDINNAWDHDIAPPSGALMDLSAFSVQPTLIVSDMWALRASAATGSAAWGWVWSNPAGIWVNPGNGIAFIKDSAAAWRISEVYVVWEEAVSE